jgi:hypothetical protein
MKINLIEKAVLQKTLRGGNNQKQTSLLKQIK